MAASTSPLIWDFFRELGSSVGVKTGGVAHYYDETAQTIFLNGGLKTRLSDPASGQWKTAELSAPSQFVNNIDYIKLDLDHPANGTLYMAAVKADGTLQFLRYQYAADIGAIVQQATFTSQVDNPITQINVSVKNVSNELFDSGGTLFNPGARLSTGVALGDSEVYPIGVAYLDDIQHDPLGSTVSISGRNAIGYFLKEASFGGDHVFKLAYQEICNTLFKLAGVPRFEAMPGAGACDYDFKPEDSVLEGFSYINNIVYYNAANPFRLAERPDGVVISGDKAFCDAFLPNSYYSFGVGRDIFKRKTKKSADAVYSSILATGETLAGVALTPVSVAITNYKYWHVPQHKILHLHAPKGWVATQTDLQWWAENEARKLKLTGIGEDFTGPLRPQLLVGDVAEAVEDGVGTVLGVVTEVKHVMGEKGFETQFSIDSGGEITGTAVVKSDIGANRGYNRKTRIADMIKNVVNNERSY